MIGFRVEFARPFASARLWLLAWASLFLLLGCANMPPSSNPTPSSNSASGVVASWEGRLSLVVVKAIEDGQTKGKSFFAHFVLSGDADQGRLRLLTPLGAVFADIDWKPGRADITKDGRTRSFDTVENLLLAAIGQSFPVTALFDWLVGQDHPVAGWKSNLSFLTQGRLSAERLRPEPRLRLKIALNP